MRPILIGMATGILSVEASASEIINGDFSDGLEGWSILSGPASDPGAASVASDRLVLSERGSFMVQAEQPFVHTGIASDLAFTVEPLPGFADSSGIPDVFEAHLVTPTGVPLVNPTQTGTAFFTLYADGRFELSDSASFDGHRVRLNLASVPAGPVRIVFTLVGADPDTSSEVAVDDVGFIGGNTAPVAPAIDDITAECGDVILLDGTGAFDPDGDLLTFEWFDGDGVSIATDPIVELEATVGNDTFTLRVSDPIGQFAETEFSVVVEDTIPPQLVTPTGSILVEVGEDCLPELPDLSDRIDVEEACGIEWTQSPPEGTPWAVGDTLMVTLTGEDVAGFQISDAFDATLVDPNGDCTPDGTGDTATSTGDTDVIPSTADTARDTDPTANTADTADSTLEITSCGCRSTGSYSALLGLLMLPWLRRRSSTPRA